MGIGCGCDGDVVFIVWVYLNMLAISWLYWVIDGILALCLLCVRVS